MSVLESLGLRESLCVLERMRMKMKMMVCVCVCVLAVDVMKGITKYFESWVLGD